MEPIDTQGLRRFHPLTHAPVSRLGQPSAVPVDHGFDAALDVEDTRDAVTRTPSSVRTLAERVASSSSEARCSPTRLLAGADRAILARIAMRRTSFLRAREPLTSLPRWSWIRTHSGAVLRFTPPPPASG